MKWYKQLPDNHPAIKPALDAFGWEGKGIMDKLTQLVQEIGLSFLDESILKMNFGFNARKCNRIFPVLSECFRELLKEFGINHETSESFTKDSKVSESFTKLEGQNPRGRNKSITREEENREEYTPLTPQTGGMASDQKSEITFPKSPAGELVGYLREKLVKKGLTDTFLNQKWAEVGVNEANILLKTEPAEEIRNAIDWFDSDERFWGKALNRMSHIRKHWDQYQRGKPDSSKASSKPDRLKVSELLKFPFIMYVPTNEIIPSSEMQYREDSPNGLYRGVNTYYPGGHLCGIEAGNVGDTGNGRHGTSATPQPCGA